MTKNKTWVIGDIHGEHKKLVDLLQLIKFDYDNDTLIQLGDVVDRGPDSYKCVEELLKIKNLISLRGNHDATWMDSFYMGINELQSQGGRETLLSYTKDGNCENDPCKVELRHQEFFQNQLNYYIDKNNNLFIHAGFDPELPIKNQHESVFLWDRELMKMVWMWNKDKSLVDKKIPTIDNFNKIFIGHTPTVYFKTELPIIAGGVYNLDTGCGKGPFPLTAMNVDTEEFFQVK